MSARRFVSVALLAGSFAATSVFAQDRPAQDKPAASADTPHSAYPPEFACFEHLHQCPTRTFQLHNEGPQNDANEVLVALRNVIFPQDRIYLIASTNTIVMAAPESQLELAAQLLRELDTPRPAYRIAWTVTTFDNGQRTGTEHFSTVAGSGQRTTLKQGSKVPVGVASTQPDAKTTGSTQYTYLDVGINLDATAIVTGKAITLLYKAEQSGIAPEQSAFGATEPVIRQAVVQGVIQVTPSKPIVLGGIDIPGSTRHLDITVEVEPLP